MIFSAKLHAVKHYLKQCKCQFKIKNGCFVIGITSSYLIAQISAALNLDKSGQPYLGDPKIRTTFFVDGCPDLSTENLPRATAIKRPALHR
jgi:hypothetical protein